MSDIDQAVMDVTVKAAFEAGVRQAIEWLRAGYEYGTGPDWREHGAEWISDRFVEHHVANGGDQE